MSVSSCCLSNVAESILYSFSVCVNFFCVWVFASLSCVCASICVSIFLSVISKVFCVSFLATQCAACAEKVIMLCHLRFFSKCGICRMFDCAMYLFFVIRVRVIGLGLVLYVGDCVCEHV